MIEAIENRFIFFPTPSFVDWQPPPTARVEDVFLALPPRKDVVVHGWWCPPAEWTGAGPVVLYLHGNSGNLSQRGMSVLCWQEMLGAAVLIVDYPGYGRSSGWPSEAGCYATADAGYEWLVETRKVPAEQIIVYGGSLGGAVAVELATRRPHRALVLVATFTSVRDLGRKLYPMLPMGLVHDRFNSLSRIGRCRRPVFIAHGTDDRMIPFSHGERLFAAANEPKRFFPLVGHDHHDLLGKDFYAELRAFLNSAAAAP
jgi:fermentation-respiration switch protein FrsA (DUF1100 family)